MTEQPTEIPFLITLGEELAERAARDEEAIARGGRFRRWRGGGSAGGGGGRRSDARGVRRAGGGRLLAVGGVLAVALVALALALTVDFGDGGAGGGRVVAPTPATAHAVLLDLAQKARGRPNAMPAAHQFFFVRSLTTRLQSGRPGTAQHTTVITFDRRVWSNPGAPGRLFETAITAEPLLGGPVKQLGDPGAPQQQPLRHETYVLGALRLTRRTLLALPTEPAALVARMRAADPDATTTDLFEGISDALREQPAPPRLRAALYRTLATLPGVRLLGTKNDPRGRRAVAIGLDGDDGTRTELYLDPATAEMLAERSVLIDPSVTRSLLPAGTTLTSTVYLRRAAVASVTDQ